MHITALFFPFKVLLHHGANVEDHNENGHTPLMEAASAGHVEVAKVRHMCWKLLPLLYTYCRNLATIENCHALS